jgi:glycosyltransferase involved in cell wall biosynthesis
MRLAWFTPWAPQPSGVAGRSMEIVPALAAAGHGIDVCVDERVVPVGSAHSNHPPEAGQVRVQSAHDFVWRAGRAQYDLVVYQVGNSRAHEFVWAYLFRWPGLSVLHDARLHHARASAHLHAGRTTAYRAEFTWNHPEVPPAGAELGVAGFDGAYYYLWPMVRDIVLSSRMVAAHAKGAAAELKAAFPTCPIEYVRLGDGSDQPCAPAARGAARAALRLPAEAVIFGLFGALTAEKRISQVLRAFRHVLAVDPSARLLLAGAVDPSLDWRSAARSLGVEAGVIYVGAPDDAGFDRAIQAADVSLNLRWPSALETSGPWVSAIAAGRPTVVTDLIHHAEVPSLDPRTWQSTVPDSNDEPIAVAIDILDEDHSLGLALRRLATDRPLRDRLGRAARAYWEREHSVVRMRDDYLRLIERAAALPAPAVPAIPALAYDPGANTRALLAGFGDLSCELS